MSGLKIMINKLYERQVTRLTELVFCHEVMFISRVTTMGTQNRVNTMMMYPKRCASFPSIRFFPRSLARGVRMHTAPAISERGLRKGFPLKALPARDGLTSATVIRRVAGGLLLDAGRHIAGSSLR